MKSTRAAFNRTSMELKHAQNKHQDRLSVPFNRTSMELKQVYLQRTRLFKLSFNRTSMELKLLCGNQECGDSAFNRTSMELKLEFFVLQTKNSF